MQKILPSNINNDDGNNNNNINVLEYMIGSDFEGLGRRKSCTCSKCGMYTERNDNIRFLPK